MFPILLKFSEPRFLEAFRNEGLLFMNPLEYFRSLEGDPARGDAYEGVSHVMQPMHIGEFVIDSGLPGVGKLTADPKELCAPVRISLTEMLACNVFCMFAITAPIDGDIILPVHRDELGSAFVLVLNTPELLRRVDAACIGAGVSKLEFGLVEYYDGLAYSGEVGPFRKRAIYRHQSEFRIVVRPGLNLPRYLRVGSLRDITSEILPSLKVNESLDFSTKSAIEVGWTAA